MGKLIANARMYSATRRVQADWKALLSWVLSAARLEWEVLDYDAPAPLNALWARSDLGAVMMCGLPYSQRARRPTLIAAPLPSPRRYCGRAQYFSDIVTRTNAPFRTVEDTFGGTVGYTLADSMSGGVAWRDHLAPYRAAHGGKLYRRSVGGLIHARGVIDALVAGTIDVGPLDSYYHDLLRQDDPAFAAQVRVIGSTAARPIPPFVATASLAGPELSRLREAFIASGHDKGLRSVMERLLLAGFVVPEDADYDVLAEIAARPHPAFEDL